jgi:hypothetical protein
MDLDQGVFEGVAGVAGLLFPGGLLEPGPEVVSGLFVGLRLSPQNEVSLHDRVEHAKHKRLFFGDNDFVPRVLVVLLFFQVELDSFLLDGKDQVGDLVKGVEGTVEFGPNVNLELFDFYFLVTFKHFIF